MAESEQEWISRRAYALWEEEGYPTGKDTEHWERARQEYHLFAPLGATKGLPKSRNGKANGADTGKVSVKKPDDAGKAAKARSVKTSDAKASPGKTTPAKAADQKSATGTVTKAASAKSTPSKPSSAKPAAIAADAKPADKKRSKKLATE